MSRKIEHIFLDVDGVLADWVGGVCDLFGVDYEHLISNWGDEWGIHNEIDVPPAEMWRRIDENGLQFWSNLNPFPWAQDLLRCCQKIAPTTILTSPSLHHSCAAGKVRWMDRHLSQDGRPFRDFLIGPDKSVCARPGALLIDDKLSNCRQFEMAGGGYILFPRPWNDNRDLVGQELRLIESSLMRIGGFYGR